MAVTPRELRARKNTNNSPDTIIMLRQAEAVKLRIKGKTFREIADTLDISLGQAHADVKASLLAGASERAGDVEEARELELMRLDNAIEKVSEILNRELDLFGNGLDAVELSPKDLAGLTEGASELVLKAADRLVKLSSERSKLLGLYAAEKKEHKVSGASLDEIQNIESAIEENECAPKSDTEST